LDIARRSLAMFDRVIVGVYDLPAKKLLFSFDERVALARAALDTLANGARAEVRGYSGLTVEFARQVGAQAVVRGLRNSVDFDFELQMAQTNHWLASDVEIVCLFANAPHHFLSGTLVREVAALGGDVSGIVPPVCAAALRAKGLGIPVDGPATALVKKRHEMKE
jgi:pantetheine-phosphate adenylyltransferase